MNKHNDFKHTPCSKANWNTMKGDHKRRLCQNCGKNVHNISLMRESQARDFINDEERCIWYYKRKDGRPVFLPKNKIMAGMMTLGLTIVGALNLQACVPHIGVTPTPGPAPYRPPAESYVHIWTVLSIYAPEEEPQTLHAIITDRYNTQIRVRIGDRILDDVLVVGITSTQVKLQLYDGSMVRLNLKNHDIGQ